MGALPIGTRVFTDRREPVACFERALGEPQPMGEGRLDAYRVLVWHGVGGQGKTALHDELVRRIEVRRKTGQAIALGTVNLEIASDRSPESALLKLRLGLGAGRQVAFPTFDFAFATWHGRARPGSDIRSEHPALFQAGESEILGDTLAWAAEAAADLAKVGAAFVPGVSLIYKYGHRLTGRLAEWWRAQEVKGKLAGLDELSEHQLFERLPELLGFDLWRAAQREDPPRLVLMVDAHEALWREAASQEDLSPDAWLRTLIEAAPGTLVAIFGRDRLRWSKLDSDWKEILEQHLLGEFSNWDAEQFLKTAGVAEPAVRARMIEVALGLPFYLDLVVSDYVEAYRRTGRALLPEAVGQTHAEVLDRFLRHLQPHERKELQIASYPESLTETLFGDLADAFLGGRAAADWPQILGRSFVTETPDGRAVLHALMREELQAREARERPALYRSIHHWLFERYDTQTQPQDAKTVTKAHERALLEAARHLEKVEPERLKFWVLSRISPFEAAERWITVETACELAAARADAQEDLWTADLLSRLAGAKTEMRKLSQAEALCEQSRKIVAATWGKQTAFYAAALVSLGAVRQEMGRLVDAEALFEDARDIFASTGCEQLSSFAMTLTRLARVHEVTGRLAEAESLYEQARGALLQNGAGTGMEYGITLRVLAGVRAWRGHTAEAEALLRDAIEIITGCVGALHPEHSETLNDLAEVLQRAGQLAEAEELHQQALAIKAITVGEQHPKYAETLCHLAEIRHLEGHIGEAEALFQQALEITRRTLGEGHPHTAIIRSGHAAALHALGRDDEAATSHYTAVKDMQASPHASHPYNGLVLYRRAVFAADLGREDQARRDCAEAIRILQSSVDPMHGWRRDAEELARRLG